MFAAFKMTKPHGFTLTELLVVLAITAVLAVLLVGVSARVSGNAQNVECVSNLRQIGLAVLQYCNDNNDAVPGPIYNGITPTYKPTDTKNLARYIGPYLGGGEAVEAPSYLKILECPAQARMHGNFLKTATPSYEVHRFGNVPWGGWAGGSAPAASRKRTAITTIDGPDGKPLTYARAPMIRDYPTVGGKQTAHETYMNAVFWDGHVGQTEPVSPYLPK